MKAFSPKRSKKHDPRQVAREARKAARRESEPDNAELFLVREDGSKYYLHKPQPQIPGYTYAF
ncbi:hypothetical protein Q5H93_10500 [Hymenobacter sp. ASUV-10]|uniref:Uncharacterized protein n=1 Tax=Hymenobacter aranciens TaxID=3063996 RepID=A0ABT9BAE9_9BACT|nr:hypothetical protein [Hymenobacter sp. ASUV-10]MDO7875162.1 hypothetical protein [Hymenobacter sp. ASUV-10]